MRVAGLGEFPIVEVRRYTTRHGERDRFAKYFESFFPEAFEQLGAVIAGSFFERDDRSRFTWVRGFHTLDARAVVSAAFYFGPVWNEHKATVNDLLVAFDDVLLLQALTPERCVSVLPAVDPVTEPDGSQGVVVAHMFAVQPGQVDALAQAAEPLFARYRAAGAREAGVFVTLDVPNNFPLHPIRRDGPYLVWLGILESDVVLESCHRPIADQSAPALIAGGRLRRAPELVVLDPTPRSRMRWIPEEGT